MKKPFVITLLFVLLAIHPAGVIVLNTDKGKGIALSVGLV